MADNNEVKFFCLLALTVGSVIAQTKAPDPQQSSIAKQMASIAIQREATRQQATTASQALRPSTQTQVTEGEPEQESPAPVCDPLADAELTPMIDAAAKTYKLQAKVLRGVIEQESASRPCAVSPKGARGLMQLMPATIEQFQVEDAFDPKQNVEAGAQFLQQLLTKYKGDLSLALAAYNAGPGTVDQAGGIPEIKETKDYVDAILKKLK